MVPAAQGRVRPVAPLLPATAAATAAAAAVCVTRSPDNEQRPTLAGPLILLAVSQDDELSSFCLHLGPFAFASIASGLLFFLVQSRLLAVILFLPLTLDVSAFSVGSRLPPLPRLLVRFIRIFEAERQGVCVCHSTRPLRPGKTRRY